MKPISLLLAAVAAVVLPAPAIAHGETAAVLVYGAAKSQDRIVVASTVQQVLRSASWTVRDLPWSEREHEVVVACISLDRPWPCVAATARSKGVDHVVVIHVENDKAEKGLVLTGQILVAGDAVPTTDRNWCSKCTSASLTTSTSDLAAMMLKHAAARRPAPEPSSKGKVGSATVANPAVPGIAPSSPQATGAAVESGPESSPGRLVPSVAIGAGVVAIGVGSYLNYRASAPAEGNQSRYVYSGYGIGLAAVGAAAVGVGVYLWLRDSRRSSAPMLSPASGGAVAGWITVF